MIVSVTAIFDLPKELQAGVIEAYSYSLNRVFLMGVPASALASLSGLYVLRHVRCNWDTNAQI
jgi:hypothetical protein